ncbi:MAG: iron complex outermembrane receptor protein, partial [Patiriisocius sp.]
MRTYALLVLLLSSIPAISQNCDNTLSGTITDLHDGSLLIGATLIVTGSERAVQTDLDGKFTLINLCNDTYFIQVSHPFCLTKGFTIKISENTTKTFKLEHHLEELNEITIAGKSFNSKSKTIFENTISKEELERFSSGTLGDAL